MKWITILAVTAALALAFSLPIVLAQQLQHQHNATKQPSAKPDTTAPDMDAHMAQHMEMCRQMMEQSSMMGGGRMGPAMMGPGMMGGDPKQQAEMMAMRGEMMKAMGDIMLKYAQRAQSAK